MVCEKFHSVALNLTKQPINVSNDLLKILKDFTVDAAKVRRHQFQPFRLAVIEANDAKRRYKETDLTENFIGEWMALRNNETILWFIEATAKRFPNLARQTADMTVAILNSNADYEEKQCFIEQFIPRHVQRKCPLTDCPLHQFYKEPRNTSSADKLKFGAKTVPRFEAEHVMLVDRQKEIAALFESIEKMTENPSEGFVVLEGPPNSGKTTLLAQIFTNEATVSKLVNDCQITTAIWVNCYRWTKEAICDREIISDFMDEIIRAAKQEIGDEEDAQIYDVRSIVRYFDNDVIFIFDNVAQPSLVSQIRWETQCYPMVLLCIESNDRNVEETYCAREDGRHHLQAVPSAKLQLSLDDTVDQRRYEAFFLFYPEEPLAKEDLSILWQICEEGETLRQINKFVEASLVQRVTFQQDKTFYIVRKSLYEAHQQRCSSNKVDLLPNLKECIRLGNRSLFEKLLEKPFAIEGAALLLSYLYKEAKWHDDNGNNGQFDVNHSYRIIGRLLQRPPTTLDIDFLRQVFEDGDNNVFDFKYDRHQYVLRNIKQWRFLYDETIWLEKSMARFKENPVLKAVLTKTPSELKGHERLFDDTAILYAARIGATDCLRALHQNRKSGEVIRDDKGRTPLSWSAANGHVATVKFLITAKTLNDIIKVVDKEGRTALSWASLHGHFEIVQLLWQQYPAALEIADKEGRTPLALASQNGHVEIVKFLFEKCDRAADLPDKQGRRPLLLAIRHGRLETASFLLGKNFSRLDEGDRSPLSLAAIDGDLRTVKFVYRHYPFWIELADEKGLTALSIAAGKGHFDVVKFLYAAHPLAIDVTDNSGCTPLLLAAKIGHFEMAKFLYERKPKTAQLADHSGRTTLDWAKKNGHDFLVNFFRLQIKPE